MFFIILLLFFGLYGFLNYFTAKRIFNLLIIPLKKINVRIFIAVYSLIAIFPLVTFIPLGGTMSKVINWIGFHWFGLFIYLLMYFLLSESTIFIIHFFIKDEKFNRIKVIAGITAVSLALLTAGYGLYNARNIKTVTYSVNTDSGLKEELNLVLLTDIHLGAVGAEDRIEETVQNINKLNPDIVCISGDIFDGDISKLSEPDKTSELFKSIRSKYGVYACLGNHDAGNSIDKMLNFLEKSNIKLLKETHEVIDNKFVIVGRLDRSPIGNSGTLKRCETTDILNTVDDYNLPVIVLDHNPANIDQYDNRADLILSGHTHKGQMFPAGIVTHLMYDVDYGYYRKDANSPQVIVSSGLGTWGMPMKVGTNSEIVNVKIS